MLRVTNPIISIFGGLGLAFLAAQSSHAMEEDIQWNSLPKREGMCAIGPAASQPPVRMSVAECLRNGVAAATDNGQATTAGFRPLGGGEEVKLTFQIVAEGRWQVIHISVRDGGVLRQVGMVKFSHAPALATAARAPR